MNNTPQGKILYLKNLLSVDVLVKKLAIKGEKRPELEAFVDSVLCELSPKAPLENIFAERFIISAWKLRRTQEIERKHLNVLNAVSDTYSEDWETLERTLIKRRRVRNLDRIKSDDPELLRIQKHSKYLEQAMYQAFEKLRELRNKKH